MGSRTDYLYARPSFLEGMARLVDVGGTLSEYNDSPDGQIADAEAMWMDWAVVGQDMCHALEIYESQLKD